MDLAAQRSEAGVRYARLVTESFVDLSYRGLALGRRIKLTQVRPTTGYLEVPMPMPVGTQLAIATDDGVTLDARVVQIHEQVGGSERPPGMMVAPALADDAAQAWWQARVSPEPPPEAQAERTRERPVTVRPRSHTVPAPPPADALPVTNEVTATKELSVYVAATPAVSEVTATKELSVFVAEGAAVPPRGEDAKATMVMSAVDQEMLAQLTSTDGQVEHLGRTGEHDVVDDGKRTVAMDAVDLSALGLDVSASGSMPSASSGAIPAASDDDEGGDSKPTATPPSGVKKRKKRR